MYTCGYLHAWNPALAEQCQWETITAKWWTMEMENEEMRDWHYIKWYIKLYKNITEMEMRFTCLGVCGFLKFEQKRKRYILRNFLTYHPQHIHYAKDHRCWTPTETCKFKIEDTFLLANQITSQINKIAHVPPGFTTSNSTYITKCEKNHFTNASRP